MVEGFVQGQRVIKSHRVNLLNHNYLEDCKFGSIALLSKVHKPQSLVS